MKLQIGEILKYLDTQGIDYIFKGDKSKEVMGFSSLKNYRQGTFTWIKNEKSFELITGNIDLAFVQEGLKADISNAVFSTKSKLAFFSTIEHFFTCEQVKPPIGVNTYISPNVKLGRSVIIGANCTIDGDIVIGENTIIGNNVVIINKVNIGSNCEIHSGCVIGHNGFGWTENENNDKIMVKHFGGVTIGNDVLIGPNSIVDRGTIDDTLIKDGVKIDALCFVAHNVIINEKVILITGSKLYGSSSVGINGYIASGIVRNQCSIGENSIVGMGAVVTKSVPDNTTVVGNPAREFVKG